MKAVVAYFLAGAAAQILIAFINKLVNWYSIGDNDKVYMKTRCYRYSTAISEWFWIDIVIYLFTITVFGIGVLKVFSVFS